MAGPATFAYMPTTTTRGTLGGGGGGEEGEEEEEEEDLWALNNIYSSANEEAEEVRGVEEEGARGEER